MPALPFKWKLLMVNFWNAHRSSQIWNGQSNSAPFSRRPKSFLWHSMISSSTWTGYLLSVQCRWIGNTNGSRSPMTTPSVYCKVICKNEKIANLGLQTMCFANIAPFGWQNLGWNWLVVWERNTVWLNGWIVPREGKPAGSPANSPCEIVWIYFITICLWNVRTSAAYARK